MTRLGEAVEALARALGWQVFREDIHEALHYTAPVLIILDGGFEVRIFTPHDGHRWLRRHVTSHEAMLVLRCYLLGTTRVRCPDCEGSLMVTEYVRDAGYSMPEDYPCPTCTGPAVECEACEGTGVGPVEDPNYEPPDCPKCSGRCLPMMGHAPPTRRRGTIPGKPTGHVDRSWAEVFLRAMPSPTGPWDSIATDDPRRHIPMVAVRQPDGTDHAYLPGDPEAREQLTRLADQLQAQALEGLGGDSPEQHPDLGVWMALWLGRVPCGMCKGSGTKRHLHTPMEPPYSGVYGSPRFVRGPSSCCSGSGLALGSHTEAMADAAFELAEGLTAQAVAS